MVVMEQKELEEVQQLQQGYERLRDEYGQLSGAYREARSRGDAAQADALYAKLSEVYPSMTASYEQLKTRRLALAQKQDEVKAALLA